MEDGVGRGARRSQMPTGAPEANNGALSRSWAPEVGRGSWLRGDSPCRVGTMTSRTGSDSPRPGAAAVTLSGRRGRGGDQSPQVRPAPARPAPPPARPRLLPSLQRSPRSPSHQRPPAAASAQTAKLSKSCGKGTSDRVGAGAERGLRAPGERTPLLHRGRRRALAALRPLTSETRVPSCLAAPGKSVPHPPPLRARGGHRLPLQSFSAWGGFSAPGPRGRGAGPGSRGWGEGGVREVRGQKGAGRPHRPSGGVWTRPGGRFVLGSWPRGARSRLLCGFGAGGGSSFPPWGSGG